MSEISIFVSYSHKTDARRFLGVQHVAGVKPARCRGQAWIVDFP